jgi:hypothetical protein
MKIIKKITGTSAMSHETQRDTPTLSIDLRLFQGLVALATYISPPLPAMLPRGSKNEQIMEMKIKFSVY